MSHINDFFTGGRKKKASEKMYTLTQPLIKFKRINGKSVAQVDKHGSVRDTDASKAAKKMAKRIVTSKELESGKNINGPTTIKFTMVETKTVVGKDGKNHFVKTNIEYESSISLLKGNKAVKTIKRKNGSTQKIEQRYSIKVSQKSKERLLKSTVTKNSPKNSPKKSPKNSPKKSPKKSASPKNDDEEIEELIKTINAINNSMSNNNKNNNNNKNKNNKNNNNKNNKNNNNINK